MRQAIRTADSRIERPDILHRQGHSLGGRFLKTMAPSEEWARHMRFAGDWAAESKRLKDVDGVVCFDLFAAATAELFEGSTHLRAWMGQLFPLIILVEFKNSDDDQWQFVQRFGAVTLGSGPIDFGPAA